MADEKTPLTLGVFPYVSPVQLAAFHAPLKDYLTKSLGRPVTLVTAPDFNSFVDRTRDGQYDIIFTAPHLGRLAAGTIPGGDRRGCRRHRTGAGLDLSLWFCPVSALSTNVCPVASLRATGPTPSSRRSEART